MNEPAAVYEWKSSEVPMTLPHHFPCPPIILVPRLIARASPVSPWEQGSQVVEQLNSTMPVFSDSERSTTHSRG